MDADNFRIAGVVNGKNMDVSIPTASFASLPYKPGAYIEIQNGEQIFRCLPEDGREVIRFIDLLWVFHQRHNQALEAEHKYYETRHHEQKS